MINLFYSGFLVFTILLSSSLSLASERQEQYWSSIKFSSVTQNYKSLKILGELLNRYSADSERFVTRSVRFGLEYKFENDLAYAVIFENRTASSDSSDEIRFIHQLGYSWRFEGIRVSARGRLEQREFSNTSAMAHRLRARGKLDGTGYRFSLFTPFVLTEYLEALDEVKGRPRGANELRLQAGVAFKALAGKVSLSYLDRTVEKPSFQGSPSETTDYGIIDLSLSWNL